jgi:hypothetical protein
MNRHLSIYVPCIGQLDKKLIILSREDTFNEQFAVNREWMYIK